MDSSLSSHTDAELVTAALQGDRLAFGTLVCRYRSGVVNVVTRLTGDEQAAEEAAQEAFLRAWQRLASYKPQYSFRSWIYRIAVNAALDSLRREPHTTDIDAEPLENQLRSEVVEPESAVIARERAERVRRAVLSLPEAARVVLVLREYESLSYQEIAAALNIPVGTVMSRLNYGRGQLRKLLMEVA